MDLEEKLNKLKLIMEGQSGLKGNTYDKDLLEQSFFGEYAMSDVTNEFSCYIDNLLISIYQDFKEIDNPKKEYLDILLNLLKLDLKRYYSYEYFIFEKSKVRSVVSLILAMNANEEYLLEDSTVEILIKNKCVSYFIPAINKDKELLAKYKNRINDSNFYFNEEIEFWVTVLEEHPNLDYLVESVFSSELLELSYENFAKSMREEYDADFTEDIDADLFNYYDVFLDLPLITKMHYNNKTNSYGFDIVSEEIMLKSKKTAERIKRSMLYPVLLEVEKNFSESNFYVKERGTITSLKEANKTLKSGFFQKIRKQILKRKTDIKNCEKEFDKIIIKELSKNSFLHENPNDFLNIENTWAEISERRIDVKTLLETAYQKKFDESIFNKTTKCFTEDFFDYLELNTKI